MFVVARKRLYHLFTAKLRLFFFSCFINRYSYGEPIPYRFSNEAYLAKLVLPIRSVADHIRHISYYNKPAEKFTGENNKSTYYIAQRILHTMYL